MGTPIHQLDAWISVTINPNAAEQVRTGSTAQLNNELHITIAAAADYITKTAIDIHDRTALSDFLDKHYLLLTAHVNHLQDYSTEPRAVPITAEMKLLYNDVSERIDLLLQALLKKFDTYISPELPAPYTVVKNYMQKVSEQAPQLTEQLAAVANDPELIQKILSPFTSWHKTKHALSIAQFRYLVRVKEKLNALPEKGKYDCPFPVLFQLIVYCNFNSTPLIIHLHKMIMKRVDAKPESEQPDELNFLYKELMQLPSKNAVAYISTNPPVKKQLEEILLEEIYYRRKITFCEADDPNADPNKTFGATKIVTTLSVAQLAVFFRAMVDCKLIDKIHPSVLLRFVADNFQTPHSDAISVKSISNKYYNIENTSRDTTRGLLLDLAKKVHNY